MNLDMIGAVDLSPQSAPTPKPKSRWKNAAALLGGPAIGGLLGGFLGRSIAAAVGGVALGGVVGLAACDDFGSLPGPGSTAAPDMGRRLAEEGKPDLGTGQNQNPDMTEIADLATSPDMTPVLDMSGPNCVDTLAGVGQGDFTIRFDVTTTLGSVYAATLLTQRASCDNNLPGWYIGIKPNGGIYAITGGGGPNNYAGLDSKSSINDGNSHLIIVQRRNGILNLEIDKKVEAAAPSTSILDHTLPAIEVGKSMACNTTPMPGITIKNVCLTVP